MNTDDFLTYIAGFTQEAEKQELDNMSEEDKILLGKSSNIASIDDIKELTS